MSRYCLSGLLTALVCLAGAGAHEDKRKDESPEVNAADVRFADGSAVRVEVLQESLELQTKYGKLTFPAGDVRRIEFAFRVPEEKAKKIEAAIRDLAHDQHARREAAGKELVALGVLAVPALQDATRSSEPEMAQRAKVALAQIAERTPADKLRFPAHDTIQTAEFTITGRLVTPSIKARTNYFGEVQLRIADLRQMNWQAGGREVAVTVDAARHGSTPSQWMETDIVVAGTTGLLITASGQVDLQPQTPGQVVTGPNGSQALGRAAGGFAPAGAKGGPARGPRSSSVPGVLLGKIGENGRTFTIGERYEGTPGEDGKLYLLIVPSSESNHSTGAYTVKITTRP